MNSKRLYKIEDGKMICGVCGGLAEYFNTDPTLIRLLCVVLALAFGSGVLAYLIAAIIMPKKSTIL